MGLLDDAISLATRAHSGQTDKIGDPYILHPLRVMGHCEHIPVMVVAVLHDVLEDVPSFDKEIIDMLSQYSYTTDDGLIYKSLLAITRRKREPYGEYLHRVIGDAWASEVKEYDARDNLDRADNLPLAADRYLYTAKYSAVLSFLSTRPGRLNTDLVILERDTKYSV